MSISDKFNTFCSNLRMDADVVEKVSSRYKQITKRLNLDYYESDSETLHSLYVGSYGRGTDIHVSDIDMLFILPVSVCRQYHGYSNNGQSALLQAVKKAICKTYSETDLGADGQVIKLNFTDGICYEIVPCFLTKTGSYIFPDSNNGGSWKTTNPRPEIDTIKSMNDACNGNLKRLCWMMRAWKEKRNVPIGGLLIDTLAYQFIKNWEHRNKSYSYYAYMSRDFFKWMADQKQSDWNAPGSGQHVYEKGLFQHEAKRCYNISIEAIENKTADSKREWFAKQKWREIYGTNFPD